MRYMFECVCVYALHTSLMMSLTLAWRGESPNSKSIGWLGDEIDLMLDVMLN